MRLSPAVRAPQRTPLIQVLKSALAAILAWLLAMLVVSGAPPIFAAIAALLVVQPSVNQAFGKAVERSIGVVAGVVIASALAALFGTRTWVVLTAIVLSLLIAWAARMTPGASNQVAISAILVLALSVGTEHYGLERILETLLGAAVGFVVNVAIVPPVQIEPARRSTHALAEELARTLERLAAAFATPQTPAAREELLLNARLLRPMVDAAERDADRALESLAVNPRGRRPRAELARLDRLRTLFSPIATQTIGMTRAFYDHYDPSVISEPAVAAIAEQLGRAARDVRRVAALSRGTDPAPAAEEAPAPALTAPLRVAQPGSTHWILIGSLLEDLGRIHEALTNAAAAEG